MVAPPLHQTNVMTTPQETTMATSHPASTVTTAATPPQTTDEMVGSTLHQTNVIFSPQQTTMATSHQASTATTAVTPHQTTDEMVGPTTNIIMTPQHPTDGIVRVTTSHRTSTGPEMPTLHQTTADELSNGPFRVLGISSDIIFSNGSPRTEALPFSAESYDESASVIEDESGYASGQSVTKPERTTSTLDVASSIYRRQPLCALCCKNGATINSHLVPRTVLFFLCKWKDGSLSDILPEKQKQYLFRTDIETGRAVTVMECRTGCRRFFCDPCEKQFRYLDTCACEFWSALKDNWEHTFSIVSNKNDMTEIVLFSFMVRAARVSLRQKWEIAHESLEESKCTFLEEDREGDFKKTVKKLKDFGFMYYCLKPDKKYRIEFPVFCNLEINGCAMKVICMQVPPFFFLLPNPAEKISKEVKCFLEKYLPDIARAVQNKLQEYLDTFVKEQKNCTSKGGKNFDAWHKYWKDRPTESGPVLIFDYIDSKLDCLDIKT